MTEHFPGPPPRSGGMVSSLSPRETVVLDRMTVRLVAGAEQPEFDRCLEAEHSLASSALVGQTLRCVADLDGQRVALRTFSAPALHLKAREKWIGWTPRQRAPTRVRGEQQPVSRPARTPPFSQSGLPGVRLVPAAALGRLAGTLGPSGAGRRELCGRGAISRHVLPGLRVRGGRGDGGLWPGEPGLSSTAR